MKTDLKKKPEQEIIARSEGRISQKYYKKHLKKQLKTSIIINAL